MYFPCSIVLYPLYIFPMLYRFISILCSSVAVCLCVSSAFSVCPLIQCLSVTERDRDRERETDRQTDRHGDRQKQTDRQRPTDRQSQIQTDRQTDKQTETEKSVTQSKSTLSRKLELSTIERGHQIDG